MIATTDKLMREYNAHTSRGETLEAFAGEILAEHVENVPVAFDPVTLTAIQEGIADGEAGREQSFNEYAIEMQARREARNASYRKRQRAAKMTISANPPTLLSPEPGRYHWTVDVLYRAVAADVFDEPKRLELAHGELWEKEPLKPPHASLIRLIARKLRQSLEPAFLVLQESPFNISEDSELIPDLYVARGSESNYLERHPKPTDVVLIIEITDTSTIRDTVEKERLYAQAGITDYWVSLIPTRELLVYRNPSQNGYAQPLRLTDGDFIRPLAAPEIEFAVSDLLVRAA